MGLCQRCNLCCDGTLFTHVPLQPEESSALGDRVEQRENPDGSRSLVQGCRALSTGGGGCRVYAERPGRCRAYRCHLLSAQEEGEVSLKEALSVVEEARQRLAVLDDALPPEAAGEGSVVQRARRANGPSGGGLPKEARGRLREVEAWLDRHFRGRHGH